MNHYNLRPRPGRPTSKESVDVSTTINMAPPPATSNHVPILPPEIMALICLQSDIIDLKNMRLANKVLAELAAKELFYEVYCILLPPSMYRIRMITAHPTFKQYVRSFIYLGDRFNSEMESREEWNKRSTADSPQDSVYDDTFLEFCMFSKVQDKLIRESKETSFLTETLASLKMVETFTLTTYAGFETDLDSDRPREKMAIYPLLERDLLIDVENMLVEANHNLPWSFATHAVLNTLGNLFADHGRSFKFIRLLDMPTEFFSPFLGPALYPLVKPRLTSNIGTVFSNTTILFLDLTVDNMGHIGDGSMTPISQLANFLSLAPNIVDMSLEFSWMQDEDESCTPICLSEVLPLLHWKLLQSLELRNVEASVVEFVNFMKRHASTLREVDFDNFKLTRDIVENEDAQLEQTQSSWEFAATEIAPLLHLKRISAGELSDDWSESRIAHGAQNGIPVTWLIEGYFKSLLLYLLRSGEVELPRYGHPQIRSVLGAHFADTEYAGELEHFNRETKWEGMQSVMVKWDEKFANAGNPTEELPDGKTLEDMFDEKWRGGSAFSLRRIL